MKKTIVYYTDSRLEAALFNKVIEIMRAAAGDIPIISVSQKPMPLGTNICVGHQQRTYLNLYRQVKLGLEKVPDDHIVYLVEHDVFYHPSHFEFEPPQKDAIYFNLNRFYWQRNAKFFLQSIGKRALSQCVSYKPVLYEHIVEQVQLREQTIAATGKGPFANFKSDNPNVDIRHGGNFSKFGIFDKSAVSPRILEIPYWGTPRMFQAKTGYLDQQVYTYNMLEDMFNAKKEPGPRVVGFGRDHLPTLFETLKLRHGAEVGVGQGIFSEKLVTDIPGCKLICIDNWAPTPKDSWDRQEDRLRIARSKLDKHKVRFIRNTSEQAAEWEIPDGMLDFVYIDADHRFDHVMQDIILWFKKIRRGGILSGHDYDFGNGDVGDAVKVFCKHHGLDFYLTKLTGEYPDNVRSWFFAKR